MVRTIDEVVQVKLGLTRVLPRELCPDIVQRSVYLRRNILLSLRVASDQAGISFLERPVFLFDDQHLSGAIDHGEVDFAINRVALVLPCPVDAVEDRVVVGQPRSKHQESLDLTSLPSAERETRYVCREDPRHSAILSSAAAKRPRV